MTTPSGKHEFEAAKIFFEERLKDYLEQDKSLATQDDSAGMVHPIYLGKLVEPYYRAAIAALKDYEKVKAECEKWKAWYEERKDVAEGTRQMFNDKVAELEKVKAEVELGKMLIADLTRDMNEYHDKAEKAEAKLERFRPLIEAARGVDVSALETFMEMVCKPRDVWEEARVKEIRALLQSPPKASVTREQVEQFIPCVCIDAYKDRCLAQPDCPRCSLVDVDGLLAYLNFGIRVVEPSKAAEGKPEGGGE